MKNIKEYQKANGTSPFAEWFDELDAIVSAKVVTAKAKIQNGIGDVKPVGEGVSEIRIDWGPGYRVYFGQDDLKLVILLAGGDKSTQDQDIKDAKAYWDDYKDRKRSKK